MKTNLLKVLILTAFISQQAYGSVLTPASKSTAVLQVGMPAYGGTGCPAGTASIHQMGRNLVLNLDSFLAEAPSLSGASFDRKSCNLRLPLRVARGYQLIVKSVRLSGAYSVALGGRVSLEQRISYVGQLQPKIARLNLTGNGRLDNQIGTKAQDALVMACSTGSDMMLTLDTNILSVTNQSAELSTANIDGLSFTWEVRRCNLKP